MNRRLPRSVRASEPGFCEPGQGVQVLRVPSKGLPRLTLDDLLHLRRVEAILQLMEGVLCCIYLKKCIPSYIFRQSDSKLATPVRPVGYLLIMLQELTSTFSLNTGSLASRSSRASVLLGEGSVMSSCVVYIVKGEAVKVKMKPPPCSSLRRWLPNLAHTVRFQTLSTLTRVHAGDTASWSQRVRSIRYYVRSVALTFCLRQLFSSSERGYNINHCYYSC